MAVASFAASCVKDPCDPPYSCPETDDGGVAVISCIPPADESPECVGTCHAWLAENCQDVVFLY